MTTSFILVFLKKSALRMVLVRTDNSELLSNAEQEAFWDGFLQRASSVPDIRLVIGINSAIGTHRERPDSRQWQCVSQPTMDLTHRCANFLSLIATADKRMRLRG
jgi:hypothetical protein